MQIELVGCTSAGKSTLSKAILRASRAEGTDIGLGEDLVLGRARMTGLSHPLLRRVVINAVALRAGLSSWQRYRPVYDLAARLLRSLPIESMERFSTFRNVVKRVGIYEMLRHATPGQVVLLDEGVLQVAHYLFVHVSAQPEPGGLDEFVRLVPLPDAIVYVRQPASLLIARTMKRGHKRIREHSYRNVARFIRRAVATFDELAAHPAVQSRLLIVDSTGRLDVPGAASQRPELDVARRIVELGLDASRSAATLDLRDVPGTLTLVP